MDTHKQPILGERIIATMTELAHCTNRHRIVVAGNQAPHHMFELHRRGYHHVVTTANCGLPRGQYDVALVEWKLHSFKALNVTLDWLVHFLAPTGVVVIWTDVSEGASQRKLESILRKLGFRLEAGTICEGGIAVAARRLDANQQALAA